MKKVVRDHLGGENGRAKVDGWLPRWMAFPPSAYTARGGVGTVKAHALVEAAREIERDAKIDGDGEDAPDRAAPAAMLAVRVADDAERDRLAA